MSLIILLLVAHWIGDFVYQTREIAENKGKDVYILLEHVAIYSAVLYMALFIYGIPTMFDIAAGEALIFVLVNFALHLYVDSQTSQLTTYFYKSSDMTHFWWTIGFDQMLHAICLIWTAHLFLL